MKRIGSTRLSIVEKLSKIISAIKVPHPIRVAIDGIDAAGKTKLGDELVAPLENLGRTTIRASIDSFHNPRNVRYKKGSNSPEGYYQDSFQNDAILSELLIPLGPGGSRIYRSSVYNYRTDKPVLPQFHEAPLDAILLFDGVFLLRPELIRFWDFKIFVDVNFETSLQRAVARDLSVKGSGPDADTLRMRYHQRYVAGQQIYLQISRPKEKADVIIDNQNLDFPEIIFPLRNTCKPYRDPGTLI